MTTTPDPDSHLRTARLRLSAWQLGQLIGLPEGARVVAVQSFIDPPHTDLVIWSPDFPVKPYGPESESPYILGGMREVVRDEDDNVISDITTWDWPTQEDVGE